MKMKPTINVKEVGVRVAQASNDPKLSDWRLGRDACAAGGEGGGQEAGGVTETPVRSSAWLGAFVILRNQLAAPS